MERCTVVNNVNVLIVYIVDKFKKDLYDTSDIVLNENLVKLKQSFKEFYNYDGDLLDEFISNIHKIIISDLKIGKYHYTPKSSEQRLTEFRDNEVKLRIAAEQRANSKNECDRLLYLITKDDISDISCNSPKVRLTNIDCFGTYIDRLTTERVKQYNFNNWDGENKEEDDKHQDYLCSHLILDMCNLLDDTIKYKGYNYIGEKRTFAEHKLIDILKKSK